MEPRLKNWKNFPPPGGWGIAISIRGQNFMISGHNPDDVVQQIAKRYRQNGMFKGFQPIWDLCNNHWCRKDPSRCGGIEAIEASRSLYIPADNVMATPAQYGAKLWGMLDTFGMKGAFRVARWAHAIQHIDTILDPNQSPETGCSTCHNEWIEIKRVNPPEFVPDAKAAARWVFEAHNTVNRKTGKPQFAWARAVLRCHWEV